MKIKLKNKVFITTILVCFLFCFSANITFAIADNLIIDLEKQTDALQGQTGLVTNSPGYIAASIIKAVLSFLGVIFIILIIYAGILWMTSSGNEEQITKAKKIMTSALIGFVICISAYAITIFITNIMFPTSNNSQPYDGPTGPKSWFEYQFSDRF